MAELKKVIIIIIIIITNTCTGYTSTRSSQMFCIYIYIYILCIARDMMCFSAVMLLLSLFCVYNMFANAEWMLAAP